MTMAEAEILDVIVRPLMTERSTLLAEKETRYTFEVRLGATKGQIKKAVEELFKVDVASVRTMRLPGKTRRMGRFESEASPVRRTSNGWPAKIPRRSRREVPELPRSRSCRGARSPWSPTPRTVRVPPARSNPTPMARKASTVRRQSSASKR